uniref:Uncharacterized protein n=1 Tax=Tetradesmus obliquus TaxID=3088 RepID=A0A383VMR8_TETOB|eukprot:jgi/Sobl393_1/19438/SZX66004.1
MSASNWSAVKGWLVGLRSLQIAALLGCSAFLIAIVLSDPFGILILGPVSVIVAVSLLAAALCITWLVFTLAPGRRAAASCCGNRSSCTTFCHDVIWDGVFAVLFGVALVLAAVWGFAIATTIVLAVIEVSFISTAALSVQMGRMAREAQQQQHCAAVGRCGVAAGPAAGLTAPAKVIEIV